jgi:polyhydroxyalkanoate synthesis regulator protein
MQEQVRKNFATFERALGLFSPFSGTDSGDGGKAPADAGTDPGEAKGPNSKPGEDEIATLKAELTAMQQRLEQLSRR